MDGICGRIVAHQRERSDFSSLVDGGTAELVPKTKWAPEIQDEGNATIRIRDVHHVDASEIDPHPEQPGHPKYAVYKRGRTTRKTTGWIEQFAYSSKETTPPDAAGNTIELRRFQDSFLIFTTLDKFCDGGDSGSPLLNSNDEVVGIIFAKSSRIDPTNPSRTFLAGSASKIEHVESELDIVVMTDKNTSAGIQTVPDNPPLRTSGDFPSLPQNVASLESGTGLILTIIRFDQALPNS